MKRNTTDLGGAYSSITLENFTDAQLREIGAIAMVYNTAESSLHYLTGFCTKYPGSPLEITTRINGTEGLVHIAKSSIRRYKTLAPTEKAALIDTLSHFSTLKTYRDAVVHCTPYAPDIGVGEQRGKRGSRQEVIIQEDALRWLTSQLVTLDAEMREVHNAVLAADRLMRRPLSDADKSQASERLKDALSQHSHHQSARKRSGKHPEFPTRSGAIPVTVIIERPPGSP